MKIRYHTCQGSVLDEVAYISGGGLVIKHKYGTRLISLPKNELGDYPTQAYEHLLVSMGFKREKLWQCQFHECAIAGHAPCVFAQDDDPSGECLMFPKQEFPRLSHHLVIYKPFNP